MARLRKDDTSYRASGLKKKYQPISDAPKHKSKKNTKRWCLGRVGREHDFTELHPARYLIGGGEIILTGSRWGIHLEKYCLKCGKTVSVMGKVTNRGLNEKEKDSQY